MKLILIRHTRVDVPDGTCYGATDVSLAHSFAEESDKVIQNLRSISIRNVYSSPSQRCLKLAQTIFGSLPVCTDERLRELDFGVWEGKMWDDIATTKEAKPWFDDYINVPCPGGESYRALTGRIDSFLAELKGKNPDGAVCIVTHAGPIRAFLTLVNDMLYEDAFKTTIGFGQIIHLEYRPENSKR